MSALVLTAPPTETEDFVERVYSSSRVMLQSGADNWCSSDEILAPVRRFGAIRFDPFSNPHSIVGAVENVMLPDDSLKIDWPMDGLIYANPPFGRRLKACAKKLGEQARRGCEILTVVPCRVDTEWWQDLLAPSWWCAWTGRVHFLELEVDLLARHAELVRRAVKAGQEPPKLPRYRKVTDVLVESDPAPFSIAMCYAGRRVDRFLDVFSPLATIYERKLAPRRREQLVLGGLS